MPDQAPDPPEEIAVTAWGIERGTEFGGAATLAVGREGIAITLPDARPHRRPPRVYAYTVMDGVRIEALPGTDRALLTVYLVGGDVAELTGPIAAMRAVSHAVEDAACVLTEQTLALRALGSPRANPGSDHDRFFAPLLDARRAAERARGALGRVAAFDARVMARRLDDAVAAFAAERFPDSPPDRRALEAELRDLAQRAASALDRLGAAAAAVAAAGDDVRFARFREWSAAVRELFAATDAAWIASVPALGDPRAPRRGLWRRVLGLRG